MGTVVTVPTHGEADGIPDPDRPRADRPRGTIARIRPAFAAAASGSATVLVAGLADSVGEHDGVSRIDPSVAAGVLQVRSPALTVLARAATFTGSELVVGGAALVVLAVLLLRRDLPRAAIFALGIGGSAFLTVAVKLTVARPRPGAVDRLGTADSTFSFPSGHTLNSTVLLALLVWLLWPHGSAARRTVLAVVAPAAAVAVGASRVYLGYHWLTDVLASGLVAVAWLCLVWLLSGPIRLVVARIQERVAPGGDSHAGGGHDGVGRETGD